jgi:hypothetical protein
MVCFIQTWICSGEATFLPSSCLKIKMYSSIFLRFYCDCKLITEQYKLKLGKLDSPVKHFLPIEQNM